MITHMEKQSYRAEVSHEELEERRCLLGDDWVCCPVESLCVGFDELHIREEIFRGVMQLVLLDLCVDCFQTHGAERRKCRACSAQGIPPDALLRV